MTASSIIGITVSMLAFASGYVRGSTNELQSTTDSLLSLRSGMTLADFPNHYPKGGVHEFTVRTTSNDWICMRVSTAPVPSSLYALFKDGRFERMVLPPKREFDLRT